MTNDVRETRLRNLEADVRWGNVPSGIEVERKIYFAALKAGEGKTEEAFDLLLEALSR